MTSVRPYLIRALYEWIEYNSLTPYLLVNAEFPGVEVPEQYIQQGQIVLNIHTLAVCNLCLGNENIKFSARFNGISRTVQVPVAAVLAIYARETGRGMAFGSEIDNDDGGGNGPKPPDQITTNSSQIKRKPNLKLIK